jgi:hypothetical protein
VAIIEKMTKEDSLIKFEDRLLEKLSHNYQALNKNLIYCFSVMFVFLLFKFNIIQEPSISGNKIILTNDQLLIFMPLLILIPYFLVNSSIGNITRIVKLLKLNSKSINEINNECRSFQIQDLDFQSQGIAGIQLQFSKWIVKKYLSKKGFIFIIKISKNENWRQKLTIIPKFLFQIWVKANMMSFNLILTAIWILFLVLIYILPLIVSFWILYNDKLLEFTATFATFSDIFNFYLLISLLLLFMIGYTLLSNLSLYSLHFSELIELKEKIKKMINTETKDVFKLDNS